MTVGTEYRAVQQTLVMGLYADKRGEQCIVLLATS
jgi:hypothetical protein